MPLKVTGLNKLYLRFQKMGEAPGYTAEKMEDLSKQTAQLARRFAPKRTGTLGRAVKYVRERQARDSRGRFTNVVFSVYVDQSKWNSAAKTFVSKYASRIEAGSFGRLSNTSVAKANYHKIPYGMNLGDQEAGVGPRYVRRALMIMAPHIKSELATTLTRYIKGLS